MMCNEESIKSKKKISVPARRARDDQEDGCKKKK